MKKKIKITTLSMQSFITDVKKEKIQELKGGWTTSSPSRFPDALSQYCCLM